MTPDVDVQLSPLELLVSQYVHEIKFSLTPPDEIVFQARVCEVIASMETTDWEMPVNYYENMYSGEMSPKMPLRQMISLFGADFLSQLVANDLHRRTKSSTHSSQMRRL